MASRVGRGAVRVRGQRAGWGGGADVGTQPDKSAWPRAWTLRLVVLVPELVLEGLLLAV